MIEVATAFAGTNDEEWIVIGGTGDLAERWGVTTQRVRQLAGEPGFPEQLGTVNGNPVWNVGECDSWRARHRRRSGRPRMSRAEVDAIAGGRTC